MRSARACAASRPIITKYAGCAQSVARMRQHCSAGLPLSGSAAAGSTSCTRCSMASRVFETAKTDPTLAAAETSSCSPLTRSGFCKRFASRNLSTVVSSRVQPFSWGWTRLRSWRNRVVPSRSRRVSMAVLNSFSFRARRLSVRSLTSSAASSSSSAVCMRRCTSRSRGANLHPLKSSDLLTCTVPPLRVESSLLKNPIPQKSQKPWTICLRSASSFLL